VRTFYFDFDSSEIKSADQESILAHGRYLAENANMTVSLDGHTDERGSREYNIGLGEQRAQAVRRMLLFQGATDRQVEVISYGEEKPVADGHDEMSYSQNRRVEIVYKR
jgi:peptidoglycan-associated lipoprotein